MISSHPASVWVAAVGADSAVDHVEVGTEHRASAAAHISIGHCINTESLYNSSVHVTIMGLSELYTCKIKDSDISEITSALRH